MGCTTKKAYYTPGRCYYPVVNQFMAFFGFDKKYEFSLHGQTKQKKRYSEPTVAVFSPQPHVF